MKKDLKKIRLLPIIGKGTYQTVYRNGKFVYKVIDTSDFNLDKKIISNDIKKFYKNCQKNSIKVPNFATISLFEENQFLINKYSFEGKPFNKEINFSTFRKIYPQLLEFVCKGLNNGLGISSFNEQYVYNQNNLVFIDFFIPAISPEFLKYRLGKDALNYYLVQFSKNSSFLSCYSHYLSIFPEYKDFIESCFNEILNKNETHFPLIKKMIYSDNFNWGLNNLDIFNLEKNKWSLIRNKKIFLRSNNVEEIVKETKNEDIVIYNSKKRFFLKEELETEINNFKNLSHETN